VSFGIGYVILGTDGGMLFVELAKVEGDWLWHNGRIGSMPGIGFDYFGKVVVEKAKDRMENNAGDGEPIA
jgi:hypothetical protein